MVIHGIVGISSNKAVVGWSYLLFCLLKTLPIW